MTLTIYVEGGGNKNRDINARCREGFTEYCAKLSPPNRRPRIVACGGRHDAFKRFKTDVQAGKPGNFSVLLVDSEGPIAMNLAPTSYLLARDGWQFSASDLQRVFVMVQAMEAWLLADRDALAEYYGEGFRRDRLPRDERHVEEILKNDLEPSLVAASRDTKKGQYHKTRHGFALLAGISPSKVEAGSRHALGFHDFLRSF